MYYRVYRRLFIVLLITLISFFIALPNRIPVNINWKGIKIDQVLSRRGPELPLKLGLDLVGGSRLTFEAETGNLSTEERLEAIEALRDVMERRVNLFGVSEPNIVISAYEGKDRIVVELPGVGDTKAAIELVGRTAQLSFAEVVEVKDENEQAQQTLSPTDLTGADLKDAEVSFDQVSGSPIVTMQFTEDGGAKFADITERNIGKQVPIILDGQVISAPVVQDKIMGGNAQISGDFSIEEAKELQIQLKAGALPVPVNLINERTIGATMGKESIDKSIRAGMIGLALVFIFMAIFYGRMGLIADIGLLIFGIITLALYKLIPVVLTLPGIAGFLLSVGMAVDANILIFERFREEKRKGIDLTFALETSFERAWDSIKDANIATLVTTFVLANPLNWEFLHTSGPVRGFAITLALGIGVSLFTGIFVSRNLLRLIIGQK